MYTQMKIKKKGRERKICGNEDLITYTKQLNPLQPSGVSVT